MIYLSSKDFRFIHSSKKCCVGFIDLVNSTVDTLSIIDNVKVEAYYSLFINSLTKIIKNYEGDVVKNIGDCLLFYFPKTSNNNNLKEFNKVIECCFEILDNRKIINEYLIKENLPTFSYRITVDYGALNFALSGSYSQIDIFGSIVNICSKLNSSVPIADKLIIGDNLYHFLSSFAIILNEYDFSFIDKYKITEQNNYGVYAVTRKEDISFLALKPPLASSSYNSVQLRETEKDKKELSFSLSQHRDNKEIRKKIIIIDDDKDIILTFKAMLENNKNIKKNTNYYDIITFTDPTIAISYFKNNLYSLNNNLTKGSNNILIILDIRMKKINEIQLYKQIKSLDSTVRILFVTGLDIIDEIKSLIPGLSEDQIKKKPIDEKVFLKTVNKLLWLN